MKPRALYYRILDYQPDNLRILRERFTLTELDDPRQDTEDILGDVDVLFAPLGFRVDGEKIMRCPHLKVIASNTTGIAHIDTDAAASARVAICALHDEQEFLDSITPTAEHAIGLMLAAWRRLPAAHAAASAGAWDRWPWGAPRMISRMRLGIVGHGRLGSRVDGIARAMGMTTAYYDPKKSDSTPTLIDLARRSDVLSLHAPARPDTYKLVSREVLEALPEGAIVVNTARGELLDTEALIDLLESKHLWAAALDTIEGEYDPDFRDGFAASRLAVYARENDNLILTPHIGGSTIDAWTETQRKVIDKTLAVLAEEYGWRAET